MLVDRVVATVDTHAITWSAVQQRVKSGDSDARVALDAIIEEALIAAECARRGITVTEDQVDEGIQAVLKNAQLTNDELLKELAKHGMDLKGYRAAIRAQLLEGRWLNLEVPAKPRESTEARIQRMSAQRASLLAGLKAKAIIEVRL